MKRKISALGYMCLFLLLIFSFGATGALAGVDTDLSKLTAADLEGMPDQQWKPLFRQYADLRIAHTAKTDPALAADLRGYFHDLAPRSSQTLGEFDFIAVMAKLEDYVKSTNAHQPPDKQISLRQFPFTNIAGRVYDKAVSQESTKLAHSKTQ